MNFLGLFSKRSHRMRFRHDPDAVMQHMARSLYELENSRGVRPQRLFIYPSGLCNDDCCYCSDGLKADPLSFQNYLKTEGNNDFFARRSLIDRLIRDIVKLGIRDVHLFGGGEPFFYKENMFYFLTKMKKQDVFLRVITNANNLSGSDARRIVRRDLLSQLNLSFNTDSGETAGRIYLDPGRHENGLNFLKGLWEEKKSLGSGFPVVDIMFTILSHNYDKAGRVIGLLKDLGVHYVLFQPLRRYSSRQDGLLLSPAQVDEFLASCPVWARELEEIGVGSNLLSLNRESFGLQSYRPEEGARQQPQSLHNARGLKLSCYVPLTTLSVCYNGNIPLCQFRYDLQYSVNYFTMESLRDFFMSRAYLDFVSVFLKAQRPDSCAGCAFCVPHEREVLDEFFSRFRREALIGERQDG